MTSRTQFKMGAEVVCVDGPVGVLSRVVVDPVAQSVTHLVVSPRHLGGEGRLVPIQLVDSAAEPTRVSCTKEAFEALERAEETELLPTPGGALGYEPGHVWALPYFALGAGMGDVGPQPVTYDRVPLGEVEVRRGEQVLASDGAIGRVQGLVIDRDHHVTHVLLQEGHLWGRKEVAIPIRSVRSVEHGIQVDLTKDEIKDLPPVPLDADGSPTASHPVA